MLSDRLALIEELNEPYGFSVWDVTTGKRFGKKGMVLGEAYRRLPRIVTDDRRTLVCINEEGYVVVDLMTAEVRRRSLDPSCKHAGWHSPTLSADGKTLALQVTEKVLPRQPSGIKLFDIATGNEIGFLPNAHSPAFSHDGKTLAVTNQGQIELWDYPLAQQLPP
jgi:hypothetical protein